MERNFEDNSTFLSMTPTRIGKFRNFGGEINFEWQIKNFLNLADNAFAPDGSAEFTFCGESWSFWIGFNPFDEEKFNTLTRDGFNPPAEDYFNGIDDGRIDPWIRLYIRPKSLMTPMAVEYSFHLKTAEGKTDADAKFTNTLKVSKGERISGWICSRFVARSKLIERRNELLPRGILTIICTLKKCGTNNIADIPNTKFFQDFKELYLNQTDSDVIIRVKGLEFTAHKIILKTRAPVFGPAFEVEMKEKATGVIDINDCDPSIFSEFLCFLYCGKSENISAENMFDLFTIADKYALMDLRSHCLKLMKNNLTIENFCDAITLALLHSEDELVEICRSFFIKNIKRIIVTEKWKLFLTENPSESNELLVTTLVRNEVEDQSQEIQEYDEDQIFQEMQENFEDHILEEEMPENFEDHILEEEMPENFEDHILEEMQDNFEDQI